MRQQDEGSLADGSPWKLVVCELEWEWEIVLMALFIVLWAHGCLLHLVLLCNLKQSFNCVSGDSDL